MASYNKVADFNTIFEPLYEVYIAIWLYIDLYSCLNIDGYCNKLKAVNI